MKLEQLRKRLDKQRPMTTISMRFPVDVLDDLKRVAPLRGFSGYQPLIRAYVGQGFRADLERLEQDPVTALVESLKRHGVRKRCSRRRWPRWPRGRSGWGVLLCSPDWEKGLAPFLKQGRTHALRGTVKDRKRFLRDLGTMVEQWRPSAFRALRRTDALAASDSASTDRQTHPGERQRARAAASCSATAPPRCPCESARWRTTSSMKNGFPSVSPCSSGRTPASPGRAERPHERARLVRVEAGEVEPLERPLAAQARQQRLQRLAGPRPPGRWRGTARARGPARARGGHELERRLVGPVQVVENHEQRRWPGDLGEQRRDGIEVAEPLRAELLPGSLPAARPPAGRTPAARSPAHRRAGRAGRERRERRAARPPAQHLHDGW